MSVVVCFTSCVVLHRLQNWRVKVNGKRRKFLISEWQKPIQYGKHAYTLLIIYRITSHRTACRYKRILPESATTPAGTYHAVIE